MPRTYKLVLQSYAKLNLYLKVLGLRKDKFHNIKTLFERIDLADKIVLKKRQDKKIRILSNSSQIPRGSANLAYRSAKLLQDKFKVKQGVDIRIIKRIPVGAGLGGGSSNAAYLLLGLNKLWKLNLKPDKLVAYARKLGSDVPFFIYNCRFAEGSSRGDRIKPLKKLARLQLWHILLVPKIKVSTPLIYKKWDELNTRKAGLTRSQYGVKILTSALLEKDLTKVSRALFNSLEAVTSGLYLKLRCAKERLAQIVPNTILMSGSGPAVFGIVSSRKEAELLARRLKRKRQFWQVFVTKTV